MDIPHDRCAGLDVHKKAVVACVRHVTPEGVVAKQTRTVGTMTAELLERADWLQARGVRPAAMESTGVSWKPIRHILEGTFDLTLVNARPMRQVPGRTTDVKDAEGIAQRLQHGLPSPSFGPPEPIRELRDLTRQRAQLIAEKSAVVNRIHKAPEDADIKRAAVATDILGVSGRAMLGRLIRGETDASRRAAEARGGLTKKVGPLRQARQGRVTEPHRFVLGMLWDHLVHLERLIDRCSDRIGEAMRPFEPAATRRMTIPGVGRRAADVIVAEIGADLSRFPTAGQLASWAGLCPGNNTGAERRVSGRTTKGSRGLRTTLVQVAWAASHTKKTSFGATFQKLARRLGKKKALVAVARKILVLAHLLLRTQVDYREPSQAEVAA